LWRGKLAECLPWWSAVALQRLQATTVLAADGVDDDGAASKHLDDQWAAIRQRFGFNDAASDRKTSSSPPATDEEEVSDLHRLYTSGGSSDETDETTDDYGGGDGGDGAAADLRPSADADGGEREEEMGSRRADPQPPPQQPKRQNEGGDEKGEEPEPQAETVADVEVGRESEEMVEEEKKEEDCDNTDSLPQLPPRKVDWRYTCLALLNTERNWYRGDIRPIHRLPVSADVLCLDFDEVHTHTPHTPHTHTAHTAHTRAHTAHTCVHTAHTAHAHRCLVMGTRRNNNCW
jgi:hypothetical protein